MPIISAYRVYKLARTAPLGLILLGDTKIRKDALLIANVGLLSAGGVQDPEERALLAETTKKSQGTHQPPPIVGAGTILSDATWSPILNDSLVIGGANGHREFHFAEDRARTVSATGFRARLAQAVQSGPALNLSPAQAKWHEFFRRNPDSFWNSMAKIPRVLARELIGLQAFGYSPQFFEQQLSFGVANAAMADRANFRLYLTSLDQAGMFANNQKR
jgi:hypothetical protein